MKVSCIVTVLNEEATIERLLTALAHQTHQPDEIIIVDGGSKDSTVEKIANFTLQDAPEHVEKDVHDVGEKPKAQEPVKKVIEKKGNRAVGRNEAVRVATGEIIVCTDAGCIPDKHWVER